MDVRDDLRSTLDVISAILLRGFVIGFALLLISFVFYLLGKDLAFRVHGALCDMTQKELDLMFYCFMGFLKLFVFVFFLIPYLAIRWTLRKA